MLQSTPERWLSGRNLYFRHNKPKTISYTNSRAVRGDCFRQNPTSDRKRTPVQTDVLKSPTEHLFKVFLSHDFAVHQIFQTKPGHTDSSIPPSKFCYMQYRITTGCEVTEMTMGLLKLFHLFPPCQRNVLLYHSSPQNNAVC